MSRRARRHHAPAFKAKVALAAIEGDMTLAQLAEHFTCTRTRSRSGSPSFRKRRPRYLVLAVATERARPRWT